MTRSVPQNLYRAEQVRQHEGEAAANAGCDLFALMQRAGQAVLDYCLEHYASAQRYCIVVGCGNNAGDGYIVALRAKQAGKAVTVLSVDESRVLNGDAGKAQQQWLNAGGVIESFDESALNASDIVIDALLGTGSQGQPRPSYQTIISSVNACTLPVIAIDVPSGINATTGAVVGSCINADVTISFVALKTGLVTGHGKQVAGKVVLADLGIGESFSRLVSPAARLINIDNVVMLAKRATHSHKGAYGRLLCVGGNLGMAGAIRLSSEAALRTGAGLVKAFVHPDSVMQVASGRPELMVLTQRLETALDWATAIVLGPGLGQDEWALAALRTVLDYLSTHNKPIVVDADALNLIAQYGSRVSFSNAVLTPHSAEAARLLGVNVGDIDHDRFNTARQLADRYRAVVVLKGAGSIIADGQQSRVCQAGNPVLATAGSGDVLAGVMGALLGQGMDTLEAASTAVVLHATAADEIAAIHGQYGMMASDLFPVIRTLINQHVTDAHFTR